MSILFRIARRFQRNKVQILSFFFPEIIGIEIREISRNPKVSPFVYIVFSRIFGSKIQKDFPKFSKMSEISRFS